MVRKLLKKDLATQLGISASLVSRRARRGMPTHNADLARAWSDANLVPTLRKEIRQPTYHQAPAATYTDALALVTALSELAAHDFPRHADALRAAMRNIPHSHRARVLISEEVWDLLTNAAFKALSPEKFEAAGASTEPDDDTEESTEDAEYVGRFLYGLACGELLVDGRTSAEWDACTRADDGPA
jgi:hypothetical protein